MILRFLEKAGFKGCEEPQVCSNGMFFCQDTLDARDGVELYAASSIRWAFGSPGLARWREDGEWVYCAGISAGVVRTEDAESLLVG